MFIKNLVKRILYFQKMKAQSKKSCLKNGHDLVSRV
jgi:hypothetical protein